MFYLQISSKYFTIFIDVYIREVFILIKLLETIVTGVGQSQVEALLTWFPGNTKEDIIKEIEKSDKLLLDGNRVYLKSSPSLEMKRILEKELSFANVKPSSKERLKNTLRLKDPKTPSLEAPKKVTKEEVLMTIDDINLKEIDCNIIEGNFNIIDDVEPLKSVEINLEVDDEKEDTMDNLNYCKLMKMIYSYNKSVQERFVNLTSDSYDNFKTAVTSYYSNRYELVMREGSFEDATVYSLLHKRHKAEVSKLLICMNLSEDIVGFLKENLTYDTVYICPYNLFGEAPNFKGYEFYVKNTEDMLKEYSEGFKLISEECTIFKLSNK